MRSPNSAASEQPQDTDVTAVLGAWRGWAASRGPSLSCWSSRLATVTWHRAAEPTATACPGGLLRLRGQCGGQPSQEDVEASFELGGAVVGGQDWGETA